MKVHLVDATYELFRAYSGAPKKTNVAGREIGAALGLLRTLLLMLRGEEVTHVGCAFDHVIESFRNDLFAGYKTGAGIEPELAAVVHSDGRIWGYTLANDVSGNRMENETLLYLYQAKHFTGALVLGPLILLSDNQSNPNLDIRTRILAADGEELFERESNSSQINAPLGDLVSWAASHIRLQPGEVFSTGTNVVPDGPVKVLSEGMTVQISCPEIGVLSPGAGPVQDGSELNPDYARLQFEGVGE